MGLWKKRVRCIHYLYNIQWQCVCTSFQIMQYSIWTIILWLTKMFVCAEMLQKKLMGCTYLHLLYLPSTRKYEVIHICKWQSNHIFCNIHHFQILMIGKKTTLSKINFVKVHEGKKRYSSDFHSQYKFGVFLQSLFVKHSLAFERYIWKTCVKNQVLVD